MWESYERLLDEKPFDRDGERHGPMDLLRYIEESPGMKSAYYGR